jgi:predicted membrane-bound spermidine synthase
MQVMGLGLGLGLVLEPSLKGVATKIEDGVVIVTVTVVAVTFVACWGAFNLVVKPVAPWIICSNGH